MTAPSTITGPKQQGMGDLEDVIAAARQKYPSLRFGQLLYAALNQSFDLKKPVTHDEADARIGHALFFMPDVFVKGNIELFMQSTASEEPKQEGGD